MQPVRIIALAALMVATVTGSRSFAVEAAANAPEKRTRYLLLDSRIIEKTENSQLTVGVVQKDKNNPLFGEDQPWEKRFDGFLTQVTDALAARQVHLAFGGLVDIGQQQQQRSFADAIRPNQADLAIVRHGHRNAAK
jgi:hypothetical protein